jgi:hypothetical protein
MADVAVVAGAIANKPGSGGEAWVRLSYVAGLRRLGWTVHVIEQIAPEVCAGPAVAYFDAVLAAHGDAATSTLVGPSGERLHGGAAAPEELAAEAHLLLNVSGNLTAPALLARFRRTAFVDVDPGFTQVWHADGTLPIPPHGVHFTIAENIGRAGCSIPTAGIRWRTTRPPVVLDDWPVAATADRRFTTVATWRAPYGRLVHDGRTYGIKLDQFRKVLPLPGRCRQAFELALDIHPDDERDLAALREHGWRLVDPRAVAGDPARFRSYVQGSGAEFSVAQGVYVDTRSGWFSDRTARYLASGKPALVQDTGFGDTLPTGEGLVAFGTLDEAAVGAEAIAAAYERHARAARAIAEEHLDSDVVIGRLLEDALA